MTLKELRESRCMTQKELAKAVGTTQVSISRYETDARDIPLKKAKLLASFFDVPWYTLYDDIPSEK